MSPRWSSSGTAHTALALLVLALLVLALATPARAQQAPPAAAPPSGRALVGRVTDTAGVGIPHAYVFVQRDARFAVADDEGRFRLVRLDSGRVAVGVRRLGFKPVHFALDFSGDSAIEVELRLRPAPRVLDTVTVAASPNYSEFLDLQGFYRRMYESKHGVSLGHFILPEEIQRRNPPFISQMLEGLGGINVAPLRGGSREGSVPTGRAGTCSLGLVLDGVRMDYAGGDGGSSPGFATPAASRARAGRGRASGRASQSTSFDNLVPTMDVKAIEVYPSAVSVPSEFAPFVRGCGLIVVWTKRRDG